MISTLVVCALLAESPPTNYDEAKVRKYTLPDPLVLANGAPVRDAKTWEQKRRPEVSGLLETQMFGRARQATIDAKVSVKTAEAPVLGGKAVRKEVSIDVSGRTLHVLLYLPAHANRSSAVFVGLNFGGNQTITSDPDVPLATIWKDGVAQTAPESSRGSGASRWQLDTLLARGYGLATVYCGDIEPDFDGGVAHGVRKGPGGPAEWGALAAWAWGLSRVADYLITDTQVDAKRMLLIGHSRLGKAALWAGAVDRRFALVISNESGEGGAALSHRNFGETIADVTGRFPYWFCGNYRKYADHEDMLPFDAHMLLALIAPRPLYVASAEEDRWSDPHGEFLSAVAASRVYELLGKHGIGAAEMPPVHRPVGNTVRYHIRAGKHDVTAYDWEQYLDFADRHLR